MIEDGLFLAGAVIAMATALALGDLGLMLIYLAALTSAFGLVRSR